MKMKLNKNITTEQLEIIGFNKIVENYYVYYKNLTKYGDIKLSVRAYLEDNTLDSLIEVNYSNGEVVGYPLSVLSDSMGEDIEELIEIEMDYLINNGIFE